MNTVKKNYYTAAGLMAEAIELAQADPEYAKALSKCPLDYQRGTIDAQDETITRSGFDVVGYAEFGTNEGIYGTICFCGDWAESDQESAKVLTTYALKTLSEDKDAFLAMGTLVNLICYYARVVMNGNLDRFD